MFAIRGKQAGQAGADWRYEYPQVGAAVQQLLQYLGACVDQVLALVEHQQQPPPDDLGDQPADG
jgi:hypothetical protein